MLKNEQQTLEKIIHENKDNEQLLVDKKKQLINQAKKAAQEKVHEMNEAFEREKIEKQEALTLEMTQIAQMQIQQTNTEIQHLQKKYEERKEAAVEKIVKEVLEYDYRENESF